MKVKISHAQALTEVQELDLSLETPRGKDCVIGRSPDADFVLDDPDVSRFHCKFFYQSGNYYFTDLGSRNGSIVNNKVIQKDQPQILSNGDVIRIGDNVLVMEELASMEQPAETVVKIINPALFTRKPSTQNIENEKPEVSASEAVINEVAENANTPVVEEVIATNEPEIIIPENINSVSVEVNEVEVAEVQADVEIPPQIADEIGETPVSESENIETNVVEIEDSQAFAAPEYTIVQPRDIPLPVTESTTETSNDLIDDSPERELIEDTHVQERNQEEITDEAEELPIPEIEVVESEVSVQDESTTETIEEQEESVAVISQTTEVEEIESTSEAEAEIVEYIPEANVDSTPDTEEVSQVEESQGEEISEAASETQLPAVVTQKYTVLIAHDSKQSELVNFVKKHQELLSECLTMTWNSVSESLQQQAGVNVSEEIPAATSGGYQRIASLINSKDILAVIFIRDLLQPQPGQANEETFLRLCNINEVLLATNLATAEAVVCYMKHGLCN
ncbi:MAG: FHA domain-containing protein [Cyanobacteriota bacterium]|nr:FHA domain-containing protein [Cyanobacteriota bacterium]